MSDFLVLSLSRRLVQSCHERDLLRRARAGEREAVGVLLQRQRDPIFRLCFQMLRDADGAEDAAQEVLLRAMEKMPTFRAESEFSTWIYRIALNHCLEVRRKMERRESLTPTEEANQSHDFANRVDTRIALENALDSLPETLRIALILRQWHDKSYAEIGDILHLPASTVKSRLYEARQQFQRIWEAQNAE